MFDPSIKEENVIVIEDHSEDSKEGIKEKAEKPPLHREPTERGKQIAKFPTGPVTRATTRLSRAEALAKGTSRISENKESSPVDSDHISDIPEAMDSTSSDDDHSSGLASRYQIKLREPKAAIDLNKPAPAEEFPEFKVKVRTDKEKIRELQRMVKQLKKEKAHVEQWSARQQERIQGFKKKKREQRALLKELRESNFKLYWHNIVLTSKLKQRTAKANVVIIS
jgi:hypothetical protein